MDEIRPCMYCGGEGEVVSDREIFTAIPRYQIRRKDCKAATVHSHRKDMAIEFWNKGSVNLGLVLFVNEEGDNEWRLP